MRRQLVGRLATTLGEQRQTRRQRKLPRQFQGCEQGPGIGTPPPSRPARPILVRTAALARPAPTPSRCGRARTARSRPGSRRSARARDRRRTRTRCRPCARSGRSAPRRARGGRSSSGDPRATPVACASAPPLHSIRSRSVTYAAGALGDLDLLAAAHHRDHLVQHVVRVPRRDADAQRLQAGAHPGDRAVVVGALHVDRPSGSRAATW
jgi:hypothetical protein